MSVKSCQMLILKQIVFVIILMIIIPYRLYSQESPNSISKRAGIAFRTDDNQNINKYLEYASIFNKYNQKFTFALNLGLSTITPEYINGVKQLQASGHEMMDHTPQHRTNLFNTVLSPDYFLNHPGVYRIDGNKIELKHSDVDITRAKRSGYVDINGDIITSTNGIFSGFSKNDCYLYFPTINQLVYINDYSGGWIDSNTVKVQNPWTKSINLGTHQNIKFYNFDINNIHITSDAIKALAEESLRLAEYYGLERPNTWIQPGGYFPQVYSNEVKLGTSSEVGYKAAGTFNGISLKVFNEYNPNNVKQFGMSWGDFSEETWTLEQCKKSIADNIAKHHVVFGASHFSSSLGGWSGFLDRTEKLIQWCTANNIPIKTYSEWSDILYRQTPDPNENIFPPLNVDLDGNNSPDGYNSNVGGKLDKTDGYPSMNDYCYTTNKSGWIFSIGDLAGIEKGENDFEFWTKGAPGNFIEVIFKLKTSFYSGTQDFVYKFPAENSEWTYYNLAQSINGNTALIIPSNISLMDVIVQCSNYSSGDVKISGMKFSKFSGTSEYLSVTPSTQSVSITAGNTNFLVSSNVSWSVSDDASWLTISPSSGSNNGTLTAAYTENTNSNQRIGTITVIGGGVTRTVVVTQAGLSYSLTITPSDRSVSYSAGTTTFSVASNTNWTASDNASWLTISPSSGSNNGNITANFTENTSTSQRVGTITITGGGITRTVTVTQAGVPFSLTVTPSDRSVSYSAESTTFSVTSNTNWTVSDNANWLTISPLSGSNSGTITANYSENFNTDQRVGTITIIAGTITRTVTVTQSAAPYLTVSPSDRAASYYAGNKTFTITSNTSWTVSDDVSWLTVAPAAGANNDTITATREENNSTYQRIGTITITGGGITQTVTVTQAGVPFSLTVAPSDRSVSYTAGSTTFSVTSNTSWTVSDDVDWLTISPTSGPTDETLTVAYQGNPDTSQRIGTITITGGGITRTVTVTQESTPSLEVKPSNQFVVYSAGTTTFSITANRSWTASDDSEWLIVSQESGVNDETLTIAYQENPDTSQRVGTITIIGGGITRTVTVSQESTPSLIVEPSDHYVGNKEGSTTIKITSNRDWAVEDDAEWLTLTPASGSNDSTLILNYAENINIISRVGTITITGGGLMRKVSVTQTSAPLLVVTPLEQNVGNSEGSTTVTITSNKDWVVEDDSDWLTVTPTSGLNDTTLVLLYSENTNWVQRIGTVTINGGGLLRKATITQDSAPLLELSPSDQIVGNGMGSTSVAITSNREWVVENDVEWLSISPISGSNDGTLGLTYTQNLDTFQRIATIIVTGGEVSRNVTIKQEAKEYLTISTTQLTLPADSGITKVIIDSNIDWLIQKDVDWLELNKYSGFLTDTIGIQYCNNKKHKIRTGKLLFYGTGISREIFITQSAAGAYLVIKTEMSQLDPDSGRISIDVFSNSEWKIHSEDEWISVDPDSGAENESITLSYLCNQDSLSRIGTIIFFSDSLSSRLFLEQKGLEVFQIFAEADSLVSGTTSGSGRYLFGTEVKIVAIPNKGWKFKNWTENGTIVSSDSIYIFNVTASRTLLADFEKILTGVEDENMFADKFELYQNYPNPFNPVTKIKYSIPSNLKDRTIKVILTIIDMLGNEITTLVNEDQEQGYHEVEWRGDKLSSGIYLYQIRASDFVSTKKMILIK